MTPTILHTPVRVEAAPSGAGSGVRLSVGAGLGPDIHLSIEQARALSLALIAAVNHQERQAPAAARSTPAQRPAHPVRR